MQRGTQACHLFAVVLSYSRLVRASLRDAPLALNPSPGKHSDHHLKLQRKLATPRMMAARFGPIAKPTIAGIRRRYLQREQLLHTATDELELIADISINLVNEHQLPIGVHDAPVVDSRDALAADLRISVDQGHLAPEIVL